MCKGLERTGINAILKRIIKKERRQLKNSRVSERLQTKALHRTQIVCETGLVAQRLKTLPESIASQLAERAFKMLADVSFDAVVIEQRVIYIKEKHRLPSHGWLIPAGRDAATEC